MILTLKKEKKIQTMKKERESESGDRTLRRQRLASSTAQVLVAQTTRPVQV